jgi:hypothetical protein
MANTSPKILILKKNIASVALRATLALILYIGIIYDRPKVKVGGNFARKFKSVT